MLIQNFALTKPSVSQDLLPQMDRVALTPQVRVAAMLSLLTVAGQKVWCCGALRRKNFHATFHENRRTNFESYSAGVHSLLTTSD
jgi:hypothetical protein